MNTIKLQKTLPQVFAQQTDIQSDIWLQELAFEKGHLYLVEASSGTGKSSLCSYLYGHRSDYLGTIMFDDRDIRTFSISEWTRLRQQNLSLLWQELRLFPELTAWENVEIKNRLTKYKKKKEITSWFEELGIADKLHTKVGLMSFGQQQRVALMRALCQPFDLLMADEPISHLDDNNAQQMSDLMLQEVQRQGAALIVTSIGKHISIHYDQILHL
ncbi:MAG: ATP-binding cassette domain-containing protein [Bacteroidaceae bacterium]|nr:ATP-binding cassette domain-containing protein [Bacteroidaceae bacterium]